MACKILHIGVFFDGTGNNKTLDTGEGSQSNIAKLSELYRTGTWKDNQGKDHTGCMIYENGVGTYDTVKETDANSIDRKYEKGGGGGGAIRIYKALGEVKEYLEAYPSITQKGEYAKRYIDVFGFSRGAAMARDFVNTFYKRNFKEGQERTVVINFIGVYDTVGSFGKAGDDINAKPKEDSGKREDDAKFLKLGNGYFGMIDAVDFQTIDVNDTKQAKKLSDDGWIEDSTTTDANGKELVKFKKFHEGFEEYNFNLHEKSANTIIHMIANDEVRKNFPLSSLSGVGEEWTYAGVHSDVGGGYSPKVTEPHGYRVGKYQTQLEADSVIAEEQIKKPVWKFTKETKRKHNSQSRRWEFDCYEVHGTYEREVTNALSFITLHRMYEVAEACYVPWNPEYDIKTKHEISTEELIKAYDNHTRSEGNEDKAMEFSDIDKLRAEFNHHSAVDSEEIDTNYDGHTRFYKDVWQKDSPDGGDGNDARYVGEGKERIVEREIYDNKRKKAILPTLQKDT